MAAEKILSTAKESSSESESVYISHLVARLAASGSQTVLRYRNENITAIDLLASIYRYARALATLGIGRGSLVALFAPNCPNAIALRYAANLIGSAAVYLSNPAAAERRAQLLAQMEPDLLVVFPQTMGLVPADTSVMTASVGVDVAGASVRLDGIATEQGSEVLGSAAIPDDLAIVISSGGTTGVPKGSRRTFMAYSAMVNVPSSPDRRQLVNGPLAYLSQVLVDVTLLGGGCVVLRDAYDASDTLATIESERITDLFLVEPQLFELMDHPDLSRRDFSSLRAINHVGASAPPTLRIRAQERLGRIIAHTYGASEAGLVSVLTASDPLTGDRFASAGRVLPGVQVRLRRENGSLAEKGEVGSIEVRSRSMAQGYRNRPELETDNFQEGWYRTHDLARIDDEGYLHILGRAADIRWIAGAVLSPTMIENTLCQMPAVRVAVVVADNKAGTWIGAVVPWEGVTIDPQVCLKEIAEKHGPEAAAPFVVIPMRNIPLTEQGKPDREAIKQLAVDTTGIRRSARCALT
jgi:acyl-CoA synthetase (AMP-forming)/AMP-acid ligase II